MERTLILIGGGEIRSKETLEIDRKIASLAQERVPDRRAVALFIGTASHDSMPYYNSFHKTYTGELGLKTDCALTVYGEMDREKIAGKFEKADLIYVSGGDTLFMLEQWKKSGLLSEIEAAYRRGVILCGLSAGAICWGSEMFTDSAECGDSDYHVKPGLGWIPYGVCPHYDLRREEFANSPEDIRVPEWLCVENNSAVLLRNETVIGQWSAGGCACMVTKSGNAIVSEPLPEA